MTQLSGWCRLTRLEEYEIAVRANRQLAFALQAQGLNEVASHFAYRAHKLQHIVLRRQRKFGQYLFSGFLDLLAGYGYRPERSLAAYIIFIFGFAFAYHVFGHLSLFPPDAFVYSLTSFHGRGFFPGLEHGVSLHDPLIMLAAFEAVIGLLIEMSFIATFTQHFLGNDNALCDLKNGRFLTHHLDRSYSAPHLCLTCAKIKMSKPLAFHE